MTADLSQLSGKLEALRGFVLQTNPNGGIPSVVLARWASDVAATEFHLRHREGPAFVCILGGTGTGKSTLLNRLVECELSVASFRRTFTEGAIAAIEKQQEIAEEWLGIPHQLSPELPARGLIGVLTMARHDRTELKNVILVDTPDVDGDTAKHHDEADRAFRWGQVAVFVVTPEKYQMPELVPYYRLSKRYGVPAYFVLNKCEESGVLDDYRQELGDLGWDRAKVFALPRNDAGYEAPAGSRLSDLRHRLCEATRPSPQEVCNGNEKRVEDVLGRFHDQILNPLRRARRDALMVLDSLRALQAPLSAIDVSPLTQQLQRRMQEQSVLYLMGPARVFERIRVVPSLLARLPRTAWDMMRGSARPPAALESPPTHVPDFGAVLVEQFTILQSKIDDLLRAGPLSEWTETDPGYAGTRLESERAMQIAREELDDLQRWLEQHWDRQPRDTRVLKRVLKMLPGGERLTPWSEAMPYLLATSLLVWHPAGWVVSGAAALGLPVAADLLQEMSNEVKGRTRETNHRMGERFDALAREQIERVCSWVAGRVVPMQDLERLERLRDEIADTLELR